MITLTAQGITINLTTYKHVARFISDIESRVMLHELESIGKDVRACDAYSINGNMKDNRRSNNLFAYWDGGNEVVVIHEGEEVFMVGIDDRELNRFIEEDDDIFDELEDRIIERFKAL